MSDPFLWYSGPAPVFALEEEPEEAVDEPQRLVEWQADNVMLTLGLALSCEHFGMSLIYTLVVLASVGHYFWGMLINLFFCLNFNLIFWEC